MILRGSPDIDMATGAWGHPGKGGKTYPHFSIGSVAMMAPAAAIGELAKALGGERISHYVEGACVSLLNAVYTACSAACIFILLVHFGAGEKKSLLWTSIMVFSCELLPYSSSDWSEPSALMWGLIGSAYLISHRKQPGTSAFPWIIWGICAAISSLIRIEYLLFFAAFIVIDGLRSRRFLAGHAGAAAFLLAAVCAHLGYNMFRYGSWFTAGYAVVPAPGTSVIDRLAGTSALKDFYWFFLSFGKNHWFWASPVLALSPLTFFFWRRIPETAQTFFCAALIAVPMYPHLIDAFPALGCSTWSWAYRFMYPVIPYLLLPCAFFPFEKAWLRASAIALASGGALISVIASLTNYHVALENLVARYGYDDAMFGRTSQFIHAPFWEHARMFPEQCAHTLVLAMGMVRTPAWETLRTGYFDIWPVALAGAGVHPYISFALWACVIICAGFAWLVLLKKMGLQKKDWQKP